MAGPSEFQLLVISAMVDGRLSDADLDCLYACARRMELHEHDIRQVLESIKTGKLMPINRVDDAERLDVLRHMIGAVAAQGPLSEPSRDLVRRVGLTLGYRQGRVDSMLEGALARDKDRWRGAAREAEPAS